MGVAVEVTVIGHGAIGARVAAELAGGSVPGAALGGVIVRRTGSAYPHPELSLTDALAAGHLIVECAGIPAARAYAPRIVEQGGTVLLVSLGALADAAVRADLFGGPGVCLLSTGAIGGLDLLRAATRDDGITSATITSTKRAHTLVQPWMTENEQRELAEATTSLTIFSGDVAGAVARFPASLNVACAVAAATGLWASTRVQLVADPAAQHTTHLVTAEGSAGAYRFEIDNTPSDETPTTSGVVAEAVLRGIERIASPTGAFV